MAERAARLEMERKINELAIATATCDTCKSEPGTHCLKDEPTPWAVERHKPHVNAALAKRAAERDAGIPVELVAAS